MPRPIHPVIARILRRKLGGGVPSGAPPIAPPATDVAGDTIYIPMGFAARVNVSGRDANEALRDIENTKAVSSNPGVFRVVYGQTPEQSLPEDVVLLYPVTVGTATLTITSDADPSAPEVPLSDTITVVTYRVATQLVFYYTEAGSTNELPIPIVAGSPVLDLAVNSGGATIRVEGRDEAGYIVPLTNPAFDNGGSGVFHFTSTTTPDPYRAVLVIDSVGGSGFNVTADGDPSPNVAPLELFCAVNINDLTIATHLTETVSLEPL